MNKLVLIGNLTKDIVLRSITNGDSYCLFTLAVKRENSQKTDFVSVKAWRELAESCVTTLRKGDKLKVTAHISTSKTKKDGETSYYQDIIADEIGRYNKVSEQSKKVIAEITAEDE